MLLAALALTATGCVSQKAYDDLRSAYRQSESQVLDLQAQVEQLQTQIDALRASSGSQAELAELMAERDRLRQALADAEQRMRGLQSTTILPPEVDSALKDLAAKNPGLMTYDPELGMVRFNSDLTFALGSTEVSPQATATLNQLAAVIDSASASGYEVRIVGHTDNVPVRNPNNVRRFGDNWGLSAFRAIAVKDVLQRAGVSPSRMSIAGYGEYRPMVANGPKGAQANRRVEIYLVAAGSTPAPAPAETAATPAPAPAPAPAPSNPADFK